MIKKAVITIFISFLILTGVKAMEIESKNAILYNLNDNSVIYEKNSNEKVQIASLTKIVTAITILENTSDLDAEVRITYDMLLGLDGYAKMGLYSGQTLTVRELLYILMLPSAADSAQALAINQSGSIDEFVNLMNKEVQKIGVNNTMFDNPIGMDSDTNYSTASDLAQILMYCLKNEEFKKIFNSNYYYVKSLNKRITKTIYNTSSNYNIDTSLILGSKTGYTEDAGLCLASTADIDGVNYLLVVLGSPTNYPYNVIDTINIYEYYKENYAYKKVIEKGQVLKNIKIKNGKDSTYDICSNEDISLYLEKEKFNNITYEYNGIEKLSRKIKKGDKLGTINVINNGEVLYTYDAILDRDIEYKEYLKFIILIIVNFIGLIVVIKTLKNS